LNLSFLISSRSITVNDVQTQTYAHDDCGLKSAAPSISKADGNLL